MTAPERRGGSTFDQRSTLQRSTLILFKDSVDGIPVDSYSDVPTDPSPYLIVQLASGTDTPWTTPEYMRDHLQGYTFMAWGHVGEAAEIASLVGGVPTFRLHPSEPPDFPDPIIWVMDAHFAASPGWHHITAVNSGFTVYAYVDGVLRSTIGAYTSPIGGMSDAIRTYLGNAESPPPGGGYLWADIRAYTAGLSLGQIQAIYQAGPQ